MVLHCQGMEILVRNIGLRKNRNSYIGCSGSTEICLFMTLVRPKWNKMLFFSGSYFDIPFPSHWGRGYSLTILHNNDLSGFKFNAIHSCRLLGLRQ